MRALVLAVVVATCVACPGGGGGASGGGSGANPKPTVTGALGFDAGFVSGSTQTGSGATKGDNLSIGIEEGCSGASSARGVALYLASRDHSKLKAGLFAVEPPNASDGGSVFATVHYNDWRDGGTLVAYASSGQVTMSEIDFDQLQNNRGSFDVAILLKDGGTSQLAGTFDNSALCQ